MPPPKLTELPATAICGNDITSSVLYVSALCAAQAVRVVFVVPEIDEPLPRRIQHRHAAAEGAEPEPIPAVFEHAHDTVIGQAVRIIRVVSKALE